MSIEFIDVEERLIVQPRGHLAAERGEQMASAVEQRIAHGTAFLTIDLDKLDSISLGGVRAILRLARNLKSRQTKLSFVNGSEAVREALHQAGLNQLFSFTPAYQSHRGNIR